MSKDKEPRSHVVQERGSAYPRDALALVLPGGLTDALADLDALGEGWRVVSGAAKGMNERDGRADCVGV